MINSTNQAANKNLNFVLDEIFNSFPTTWGRDVKEQAQTVPANILETNDGYQVELLAPGRNKEDFKVNIEKQVLTVSYEKQEQAEGQQLKTIRKEFQFKNFKRSFQLDEKINADGIEGKYENGVLRLFLPKREEVKVEAKQVTIL